ncbi:hypothetical protein LCGC14_2169460 [marine sediment metagenome]|uniref:Uncharacterized protein n=1 Tax=marine sediment metagenome TaxID=412755 RepID=A0A0F9DQM2_9ZZZZ
MAKDNLKKENRVGSCPGTIFEGCYNDSWKDHIVPEAFAHP